jgi:hypothetical protein
MPTIEQKNQAREALQVRAYIILSRVRFLINDKNTKNRGMKMRNYVFLAYFIQKLKKEQQESTQKVRIKKTIKSNRLNSFSFFIMKELLVWLRQC